MRDLTLGLGAEDFIWATGIEDTFIPQTRRGYRPLDEYELMGHYEHWREDLALTRELGVRAIRWGVPWYRVEPAQGEFDWRWADQVIPYLVEDLGVTPIIDLMHYGCPYWLRREFVNPDYPQAVARYAAAFAQRYGRLVRWYTPLNEPLINAYMCGRQGVWPPYLRGEEGYVQVLIQVTKGIVQTVAAIQAQVPQAVMVHVEATGLSRAARADLHALAVEEQRRGYIVYDLLTGRVTPDHPLFPWLVRHGAGPDDLERLARAPLALDVMGMNFYPQWSTKQLYVTPEGRLGYRNVETDGSGFAALIQDYYERYQTPIIITETSAKGAEEVRAHWLEASVAAVKRLRGQGIPVVGYTWFPLFTMIDWDYRTGRQPLANYRLDLGLYTLADVANGSRWRATPLVAQYQAYCRDSHAAVGDVADVARAPA